jgi:hypothetical protein
LVIVEFRERDAFGIAIKLFVLLFVGHLRPLRENLKRIAKINKSESGVRAALAQTGIEPDLH